MLQETKLNRDLPDKDISQPQLCWEGKSSEKKARVLWKLIGKASFAQINYSRIQGHGNQHGEPEASRKAAE